MCIYFHYYYYFNQYFIPTIKTKGSGHIKNAFLIAHLKSTWREMTRPSQLRASGRDSDHTHTANENCGDREAGEGETGWKVLKNDSSLGFLLILSLVCRVLLFVYFFFVVPCIFTACKTWNRAGRSKNVNMSSAHQRVRRNAASPALACAGSSTKQGPMKAILPVSLMRQAPSPTRNSQKNNSVVVNKTSLTPPPQSTCNSNSPTTTTATWMVDSPGCGSSSASSSRAKSSPSQRRSPDCHTTVTRTSPERRSLGSPCYKGLHAIHISFATETFSSGTRS